VRNNSVIIRDPASGRFAIGNPGNPGNRNGGGRPMGSPSKAAWIREQILNTCDDEAIRRFADLAMTDPKLYWRVICRVLPKCVEVVVTTPGLLAEEADRALARFHERPGIRHKNQLGG